MVSEESICVSTLLVFFGRKLYLQLSDLIAILSGVREKSKGYEKEMKDYKEELAAAREHVIFLKFLFFFYFFVFISGLLTFQ